LQWCCNKQIGEDLEGCLKTDDQLGLYLRFDTFDNNSRYERLEIGQ